MIDIENIKKEFKKYVSDYNPENERIALKIAHIARVASNSRIIATNLNLTEEEINLAEAIGYFHDLGRFEQVRIANTFSDKESKINHGEMSVKVLFENDYIRDFIADNQYDEIIKKAVLNHNKPHIESNLSEKELLFSKIIRDADKVDILYTISIPEYSFDSIFWYKDFNLDEISEDIINDFKTEHYIYYSKIQNNADVILVFYAYIFDLYFPISLKIISENKYLDTFTARVFENFNSEKIHYQVKNALEECHKYLKK